MIRYKKGFKYQLAEDYSIQIDRGSDQTLELDFITLTYSGALTIKKGYAWDGPSGPTVDTKNFMRGSLVHDALYQLIRLELFHKENRKYADQLLRDICLEEGMHKIRAQWVYLAVRIFGKFAADPIHKKRIHVA